MPSQLARPMLPALGSGHGAHAADGSIPVSLRQKAVHRAKEPHAGGDVLPDASVMPNGSSRGPLASRRSRSVRDLVAGARTRMPSASVSEPLFRGPSMFKHFCEAISTPSESTLQSVPRFTGGNATKIDQSLVTKCTVASKDGKVTDLNFHFKFLDQISGLEAYRSHLRSLDLSSNNIKIIENLNNMVRLQVLKLCGCEIVRIQNLEHCTNLKALYLQDNRIVHVEGFTFLRALEYLNLDSNRIKAIRHGLSNLAKLKELHISSNQLTSLDGLSSLRALETLCASCNRIEVITYGHLQRLERLDELRLAGNGMVDLGFLSTAAFEPALPRLEILDVANNALTAAGLDRLPYLSRLSELDISANKIDSLSQEFVDKVPAVEVLDLSKNWLTMLEHVELLKHANALRELYLQGNAVLAQLEQTHDGIPRSSLGDSKQSDSGLAATNSLQRVLNSFPALQLLDSMAFKKKLGTVGTNAMDGGSDLGNTFRLTRLLGVTGLSLRHERKRVVTKPMRRLEQCFAGEEKVEQWQQHALSGFAAIASQIDKLFEQSDADLSDMEKFLQNAKRVQDREKEITRSTQVTSQFEPLGRSDHTFLRQAPPVLRERLAESVLGYSNNSTSDAEEGADGLPSSAFESWAKAKPLKKAAKYNGECAKQSSKELAPGGIHNSARSNHRAGSAMIRDRRRIGRSFRRAISFAEGQQGNLSPLAAATPSINPGVISTSCCHSEAEEVEEVPDSQVDLVDGASEDAAEVEEDIVGMKAGAADASVDHSEVKQAQDRLRVMRGARKNLEICRSSGAHCRERMAVPLKHVSRLPRPLPFPSVHS